MKKSMTSDELKKSSENSEKQEKNYKLKIVLTLFMYVVAFGISYVTYQYYPTFKNQLLFNDAKIKKLPGQINLITEIGLIISYLIVANWILYFLVTTFTKKEENHYANALARNIGNTMQHFIIFLSLFSYILINDQIVSKKKQIVLYANWFVISRFLYVFLSLVDARFKTNLRQAGLTLGVLTIIVILLRINEINPFDFI